MRKTALSRPDLFVGIPTWNSETFLSHCLEQLIGTSRGVTLSIAVLDNCSTDRTQDIARRFGCSVTVKRCSLPDALNTLLAQSNAPRTLLMHADTILLSDRWFDLADAALCGNVALVSPQDIGCGPFSRPWGRNMPESSFLLFDTRKIRRTRTLRWERRFRVPHPKRVVDFFGAHVTHNLPAVLRASNLGWKMMKVHTSNRTERPIYCPEIEPAVWSDELPHLLYGLGNFYSIDGEITHYHNWYERVLCDVDPESSADRDGIPLAYLQAYTRNFLDDLRRGAVDLPDPATPEQEPVAL